MAAASLRLVAALVNAAVKIQKSMIKDLAKGWPYISRGISRELCRLSSRRRRYYETALEKIVSR